MPILRTVKGLYKKGDIIDFCGKKEKLIRLIDINQSWGEEYFDVFECEEFLEFEDIMLNIIKKKTNVH